MAERREKAKQEETAIKMNHCRKSKTSVKNSRWNWEISAKILAGIVTIGIITTPAVDATHHHRENGLENIPSRASSVRHKRSFNALPSDAHKIIIHNMRNFDVFGSSSGAYIVFHGSGLSVKIPGIEGNVINGVVTDAFYRGIYNIYFTVQKSENVFEYYAMKDGEAVAHKIRGLPDEATLLCIHNLGGVLFFGSFDGAYELMQGSLDSQKVPHIASGRISSITALGLGKYNISYLILDPPATQTPVITSTQSPATITMTPVITGPTPIYAPPTPSTGATQAFVNHFNQILSTLSQSIQNDPDTNTLGLVGEANVANRIKQAGADIANIKLNEANIGESLENLGIYIERIGNTLEQVGPFVRSLTDIPGLARGSELQGNIFKKIKEIMSNVKNNENDHFKSNVQVLASSLMVIGNKVLVKNALGYEMKAIGEDLSKINSIDENSLATIGSKLASFGSLTRRLSPSLDKGKETANQSGLALESIGNYLEKFSKS